MAKNQILQKFIDSSPAQREQLNQKDYEEIFFELTEESTSEETIIQFLEISSQTVPTKDALVGAAKALQSKMVKINLPNESIIVDTCGTGGSGLTTFNTSTLSALVLATFKLRVAKHGNRAVSGKCGSADLLESLGIKIDLAPSQSTDQLTNDYFTFLFAPNYHPAVKKVALARKKLGKKTIFNYLGPLLNPAKPTVQIIGLSNRALIKVYAEAAMELGINRGLIVTGDDGLDEITVTSNSFGYMIADGMLNEVKINPENYFKVLHTTDSIKGGNSIAESKDLFNRVLKFDHEATAIIDLVSINAGYMLYLTRTTNTPKEGIDEIKARLKSDEVIKLINKLSQY